MLLKHLILEGGRGNFLAVMSLNEIYKIFPEFRGPAQDVLRFARKKRPDVTVATTDKVTMTSAAYEYNRKVYLFRNDQGVVKTISGGYSNSYGSYGPEEAFAESGNEINLTASGAACMEIDTGGFIRFWVGPNTVAQDALPGDTDEEKLDPVEDTVLDLINGIKSSYRKDEWERMIRSGITHFSAGVPQKTDLKQQVIDYAEKHGIEKKAFVVLDFAKERLKQMGLLNKAGAITPKGKANRMRGKKVY